MSALTISQISDIVREAQIAFCLNKFLSFEVALVRKTEEALASMQAEAPQAGWKLVPVEPTLEMCLAEWNVSMSDAHSETGTSEAAWRAMLNAAPEAPQATKDAEIWHALVIAEAALADIGDADREPGDDVAWCEARASEALPTIRAVLAARKSQGEAP